MSRSLGPGKLLSWFNGWWVVGLAILIGMGGPLMLAFNSWQSTKKSTGQIMNTVRHSVVSQDGYEKERALVQDYGLSERLQLTVALVTTAALRLTKVRIDKGMPTNTGSLYAGMISEKVNNRPIMPEGLSEPLEGSTRDGVIVSSSHGLYLLRYSPQKGMVEVMSMSSQYPNQPLMLARIPDDPTIFGGNIGFYTKVEYNKPPGGNSFKNILSPAFADSTRLVGEGWRIVKLGPQDIKK
jgi:hypothetical protein